MFRVQLYLMITGMPLCPSILFAAIRMFSFSQLHYSFPGKLNDLHTDMCRVRPSAGVSFHPGIIWQELMVGMMKRLMTRKIYQHFL